MAKIFLQYENIEKSLTEWANELKIPYSILYNRYILNKWSVEETLTTPVPVKKKGIKIKKEKKSFTYNENSEVTIDMNKFSFYMSLKMVFREEEEGFYYCAYLPDNLNRPIADNIVQAADGSWLWNSYSGCEGATRHETAAKIASICEYNC